MFYRFTFDLISKPFLLLIVILFILFHLQKLPKNEVIWFWFPVAFSIELTYHSGSLDISHVSICSSPFKCLENEKLSNGQLKLQAHWTHWTVPAKTAKCRDFTFSLFILFIFCLFLLEVTTSRDRQRVWGIVFISIRPREMRDDAKSYDLLVLEFNFIEYNDTGCGALCITARLENLFNWIFGTFFLFTRFRGNYKIDW